MCYDEGGFIRNLKFLELLQMGGGLIFQQNLYSANMFERQNKQNVKKCLLTLHGF